MKPHRAVARRIDLIVAKALIYILIVLLIAYVWENFDLLRDACRTTIADWWR
jgi:hypothetical protein